MAAIINATRCAARPRARGGGRAIFFARVRSSWRLLARARTWWPSIEPAARRPASRASPGDAAR
eukprot:3439-Pelagococcus_subviridis.AAC.1